MTRALLACAALVAVAAAGCADAPAPRGAQVKSSTSRSPAPETAVPVQEPRPVARTIPSAPTPSSTAIAPVVVAFSGPRSRIERQEFVRVRSEEGWKSLWFEHDAEEISRPGEPPVWSYTQKAPVLDFSTHEVVAHLGRHRRRIGRDVAVAGPTRLKPAARQRLGQLLVPQRGNRDEHVRVDRGPDRAPEALRDGAADGVRELQLVEGVDERQDNPVSVGPSVRGAPPAARPATRAPAAVRAPPSRGSA